MKQSWREVCWLEGSNFNDVYPRRDIVVTFTEKDSRIIGLMRDEFDHQHIFTICPKHLKYFKTGYPEVWGGFMTKEFVPCVYLDIYYDKIDETLEGITKLFDKKW